jgi:uncharacterized protein YjbI with pentapeptide repeats
MQESNNLQNKVCFFGEQFSEEAKNFLRNEVCKDLPIEFEQEGKFYCVLHFPNNQKRKNTNFAEVIKQRIDNQENNFCGTYFSKNTNFKNHTFKTDTNFEQSYFEDVSFDNVIFEEEVSFAFSALKKSRFQNSKFNKLTSFIETVFAADTILWNVVPSIDFSKTIFSDAVFLSCVFHNKAHFNDVIFEEANFSKSIFKNGAGFFSAKFLNNVGFDNAIFDGNTEFNHSIFDCDDRDKKSAKEKSFIISTSFRNAKFQDVSFTNTTFEAIDFNETVFDRVQFWESTFNSYAGFESSIFESIDFYKVKFLNEADFKKAKFQGRGGFFWSEFLDKVQFNEATFENTGDILFNFTAFQKLIDFSSANISGYLSFNGTNNEKVFFDRTDLNFEYVRIEKPEKVSFHTVDLRPYWFVNVDSRKFTFANIDWGENFGKRKYKITELNSLEDRGNKNSKELFKITCRQLAENAENNNRFEEASNFRRMAFETERLERKEKQVKWRNEEFLCSEIFGVCFSKLKTAPYDFVHFLYRASSSYGESSIKAFFVLLAIIFLAAFLYWSPLSQFPIPNKETSKSLDFLESIFYSLRVMVLQRPEPFPANTFGKAVLALESVLAPLQLALLALAIRRKFMR